MQQANIKLAELLLLLKTEEGRVALQTYVKELDKVSQNPLGLKLLLLFKQYNFDDFSTLRSVSTTINQLGNEDLLNPATIATAAKTSPVATVDLPLLVVAAEDEAKVLLEAID